MICVSIAEKDPEKCIETLKGLEFAEIRMDMMNPCEKDIKKIFSQPVELIATFRPGKVSEQKRKTALLCAIKNRATFVDIELETKKKFRDEIIKTAKEYGCKVIISFHDYNKTLPKNRLKQIVKKCFAYGADIAKIACKVHSKEDNIRLLSVLESEPRGKVIVVGMGEKGKITRIAGHLLGNPITFVCSSKKKKTAQGQIEKKELERIIKMIKNA